jgi:hypothetical protein
MLVLCLMTKFTFKGSKGKRGYERGSDFSRFQIEAAATNSEKPIATRTVHDNGLPGSFGRANAPNQS